MINMELEHIFYAFGKGAILVIGISFFFEKTPYVWLIGVLILILRDIGIEWVKSILEKK